MKLVFLSQQAEVEAFVRGAATYFSDQDKEEYRDSRGLSTMRTYTDGPIVAGCLFAMRWGMHDRAVVVFKLDESFEPTIYCDVIPERREP